MRFKVLASITGCLQGMDRNGRSRFRLSDIIPVSTGPLSGRTVSPEAPPSAKANCCITSGGVDTGLFPGFDDSNDIDYSQNYAFQTVATNMRGFKQNVRSGNSFAVINSELRFPVFKYFFNRPLKSDFLNNFQVVGFGDLGAPGKGLIPFRMKTRSLPSTFTSTPIYYRTGTEKPYCGRLRLRIKKQPCWAI
jgi:hypothetical protein